MPMKILKTGQQQLLTDLLSAGENWSLRLYTTSHTNAVTDTLATFTAIEATFTGYAAKTLTRSIAAGTWAAPALTGTTIDPTNNNAKSTYPQQTWNATSVQTVYGYFLSGVTSGVGVSAEQFASAVSLINPSTLNLTPVLEFGSA